MRQLLTRLDDHLHARLKARAAAEGRSMNALVTDLLRQGVFADDERARVRARLDASGLRVVVQPTSPPPSMDEAVAATRGAGRAATEALEAERSRR